MRNPTHLQSLLSMHVMRRKAFYSLLTVTIALLVLGVLSKYNRVQVFINCSVGPLHYWYWLF